MIMLSSAGCVCWQASVKAFSGEGLSLQKQAVCQLLLKPASMCCALLCRGVETYWAGAKGFTGAKNIKSGDFFRMEECGCT